MNIERETKEYNLAVERLHRKISYMQEEWEDCYEDERSVLLIDALQMVTNMAKHTEYLEDSLDLVFYPMLYIDCQKWSMSIANTRTLMGVLFHRDIANNMGHSDVLIEYYDENDSLGKDVFDIIQTTLNRTASVATEVLDYIQGSLQVLSGNVNQLCTPLQRLTDEEIAERFDKILDLYAKAHWQEGKDDYKRFLNRVKHDIEGRKQPGQIETTEAQYGVEYTSFYEEFAETRGGKIWRDSNEEEDCIAVELWKSKMSEDEMHEFCYYKSALEWLDIKRTPRKEQPEKYYAFIGYEHLDRKKQEVETMRSELIEEAAKYDDYSKEKSKILSVVFEPRIMNNQIIAMPKPQVFMALFADCVGGLSRPSYNEFKKAMEKRYWKIKPNKR